MKKTIKAAAVQFEHKPGDKEANLSVIRRFVESAAKESVQIIAFPECCITGYWHLRRLSRESLVELAEAVPEGSSTSAIRSLAKKHNMIVGAGLVESESDTLYNTYVVALPTGEVYHHRKLHCFISEYMDSGSSYTVFDTPLGHKVGVLTCYDNNIGENARITALNGAEILLAPHQTGGVQNAGSAYHGSGGQAIVGQPAGRSRCNRERVQGAEGTWLAAEVAAHPRSRQRLLSFVQQWSRCG